MAELGKINQLRVVKKVDFGVYLDGGDLGEILMPSRYVPESCQIDQTLEVFVYLDSDEMTIATTVLPHAVVGQCAHLKVVDINHYGAFLDWGLAKDLLVPYSEQIKPLEIGNSYVFHVFLDEQTNRIAASAKLNEFLSEEADGLEVGEKVDLLICARTDMGYKAVINGGFIGLIFKNEVFRSLREIGRASCRERV